MKLTPIETGLFKLDGGAMFGVVPKTLWSRVQPADSDNLCTWSMRCLLIQTGERTILVDTGIGNKQGERFQKHFQPHGDDTLTHSLHQAGVTPEEITDVFLTHLHFDHVGGAVVYTAEGQLVPAFPNATYWSNKRHWNWAMNPNPREQASFLKENFVPLLEAGVVSFLELNPEGPTEWLPGIRIHQVHGHTEAMMLLEIDDDKGSTFLYCADLIPSSFHISMPWIMAYDVRPLETLREKEYFLTKACDENWHLIFEHDPHTPSASLMRDSRGRIIPKI
jgi:glyoxylase-like metal-dependent hydrolase (beta-lactamase superfamily II)